jgi:hypothetical protein
MDDYFGLITLIMLVGLTVAIGVAIMHDENKP